MKMHHLRIEKALKQGFTIVELLVVIVVIGILATVTIVAYNNVQGNARDKSVLSDMSTLNDLETNYGIKNNTGGLAWYSGNGVDANLNFTPSKGNVIDVVANSSDYCIRAYNPQSATYKTLATAGTKESTPGACTTLLASVAAGGAGGTGIVGWWEFNGNASDQSSIGNNGTVTGATLITGQNGLANGAYSFNGSSNYISIPTTNWPTTLNATTVSFWAKPTNASNTSILIASADDSTNRFNIHLPWGDNNIYWDFGNTSTGGRLSTAFNAAWFNVWSHWAFTVDPAAGMKIYRNGTVIASNSTSSTFSPGTKTLNMAYFAPGPSYWNGSIDDMRIYNQALSSAQIQSLYSAGAQ